MDSAFIHQAANELVQNAGTRNIKQIARSCSLDISETSRIKDSFAIFFTFSCSLNSLACFPSLFAFSGFFSNPIISSANILSSPTGVSMPLILFFITILAPPIGQSVHTTGSPIAIASSIELDIPSKSDDDTKTLAFTIYV